jgi:hypothetical protein
MRYFLITDLAGTLIEQYHLGDSRYPLAKKEYSLRIKHIAKRLNEFINGDNEVAIITSADHAAYEKLKCVLSDIDDSIVSSNRKKIHYYIATEGPKPLDDNPITVQGSSIHVVYEKDEAYKDIVLSHQGFFYIAVDDAPYANHIFPQILRNGGECSLIKNDEWRIECSPAARHDPQLRIYIHDCDMFSSDELLHNHIYLFSSPEEAYRLLNTGQIDINNLPYAAAKRLLDRYLKQNGFEDDRITDLYNNQHITIEPSFEQVFQKKLRPKLNKCYKR